MEFDWLEALEARVREAVDRLAELDRENRKLGDDNRKLRAELKELEARAANPDLPFTQQPAGDAPTLEEIEVLRGRIEELESTLTKAEADRDEARAAADRYSEEREEVRKRVEALTERLQGLAGQAAE